MYKKIKRILDIFISFTALVFLSPLLTPIIIILTLTGEGFVWYQQDRVGYKNKIFKILKFASMLKDSPNMKGGIITTKNDPRITPIGGFLRKTKINELPQLINILKGEMSFVGPRPVMNISYNSYPENIKSKIYNIVPGLTGIGSIIFRDEEELISEVKNKGEDIWEFYQKKIYPYKGKLEIWYQENQSFILDIKIIIVTFWVVLFPKSKIIQIFFKSTPKREF